MDLVRDVLDKQLLDREGRKMGRADGLVLVLRAGRPPRVAAIETGLIPLAARLHRGLGARVERWQRRLGVGEGKTTRVAWDRVKKVGIDVVVDIDARRTSAYAWEDWLRDRVIARIPGSGGGK
jgi:sporulation protein YlmC with PRC-barrel domain